MRTTTGPSGRDYHHASHGSVEDVIHFQAETPGRGGSTYVDVTITMRDVLALAAVLLRSRSIAALEDLSDEELLGLPDATLTQSAGAHQSQRRGGDGYTGEYAALPPYSLADTHDPTPWEDHH